MKYIGFKLSLIILFCNVLTALPLQTKNQKNTADYSYAWKNLKELSLKDRENATIQLEIENEAQLSAIKEIKMIENLWEEENFNEAIKRLRQLEASESNPLVSLGISWKQSRQTLNNEWGTDVKISDRTVIMSTCLDFDEGTENLFSVLRFCEEDLTEGGFSVNISTDGGSTWAETYAWGTGSIYVNAVSATVFNGYLYVGYSYGSSQSTAHIRRFNVADGSVDTNFGDTQHRLTVFNKSAEIKEIALVANTDYNNNGILYLAILNDSDGSFVCFVSGENGSVWVESPTGIINADRGLDACHNIGDYLFFASYYSKDNALHIARANLTEWADMEMYLDIAVIQTSNTITSISAYEDTIFTAFRCTFNNTNSPGIRYFKSMNGGISWHCNDLIRPTSSEEKYYAASVAARKGGGIAVAYMEEQGNFDKCWFTHNDYDAINWSDPEQFNEIDCKTTRHLSTEWLPPLSDTEPAYGVVFIAGSQKAYFDRLDATEAENLPDDWNFTSKTGNSATVLLLTAANPNVNGAPLAKGDYVGVFTSAGMCCGWATWQSENMSLTVWGDDEVTPEIDGFTNGEQLYYRIYKPDIDKEWTIVQVEYSQGDGLYATNDIFILSEFDVINASILTLNLSQGWNTLSINVEPNKKDVKNVFNPVQDQLVILKNSGGQTYIPQYSINTIGDIDFKEGYQAYLKETVSLNVTGSPVSPDTPIELEAGWSMISYLPETPIDAAVALKSIENQIVIVKNNMGQSYIPAYNINSIGNMETGQGYYIYVKAPGTLIYPTGNLSKNGHVAQKVSDQRNLEKYFTSSQHHFQFENNTGKHAIIVLPTESILASATAFCLTEGDEIGVFNSDGLCCGAVVWDGLNTSITAWGNNSQSEEIDGFRQDEQFQLRVWQRNSDLEFPVHIQYCKNHPDSYQTNGFSVVSQFEVLAATDLSETKVAELPIGFDLLQNYPNPFNPVTTVEYHLMTAAEVSLTIFDLQGHCVRRLVCESKDVGSHSVQWDGRDEFDHPVASGMYVYRIHVRPVNSNQAAYKAAKKMVLMK